MINRLQLYGYPTRLIHRQFETGRPEINEPSFFLMGAHGSSGQLIRISGSLWELIEAQNY